MRLKNEELAAFIILVCAVLAVGALYLLSGVSEPYSWTSGEGDRVTVTGLVLNMSNTYRGGHIILCVKTEAGPLNVFVPSSSDAFAAASMAKPGDVVEVTGIVQVYKEQKEVVVEAIKAN